MMKSQEIPWKLYWNINHTNWETQESIWMVSSNAFTIFSKALIITSEVGSRAGLKGRKAENLEKNIQSFFNEEIF